MKVSITNIFAELPVLLIVITVAITLYLWQVPLIIWTVVFGGATGIWTFSQAIKYSIHSPRPAQSYKGGYSFPSGHTTLMLTLALLVLPISFAIGITLCILGLISGAARVRAGIHFKRDILGSVVISIIGVFFIQYLISSIL